jgi:hypothetical protein
MVFIVETCIVVSEMANRAIPPQAEDITPRRDGDISGPVLALTYLPVIICPKFL